MTPKMHGMFTLRTAADLLEKLRHDHRRVHEAPTDPYAAFDFFVTAEHMPEWMGDDPKRPKKGDLALLRVVCHVANGAKHFHLEPHKSGNPLLDRHKSVRDSGRRGGYWPARYFTPSYWPGRFFTHEALYVALDGRDPDAVREFGQRISVVDLADRVLQFWTDRLS